MLTRLAIRNFKRLSDVSVELGNPVVFVGPNNSGKTTALQALALWQAGLDRWLDKREGGTAPEKRPGVAINRRDIVAVPTPTAKLLWRGLHTHALTRPPGKSPSSSPIQISVLVEGVSNGTSWTCGLEFDYANEESIYCRPMRLGPDHMSGRMPIPDEASAVRVAFLPPMSGLASIEERVDRGAIRARIGEGRTAEVLRNLCYLAFDQDAGNGEWASIVNRVQSLFGVSLLNPDYSPSTGRITLSYTERDGTILDISAAGRGLQQTLLLLAHMSANKGAVLLLDEPDAHLEILRQRQIYQVLSDAAHETGSQVIAATHSEVVLNEAADRDMVVAFVGRPHRIDDRGKEVLKSLKSLKSIGFDQYFQAEQTGWVLYVEGATDLAILRSFARILGHPAAEHLERPFVKAVGNQPRDAREHFFGLREAKTDLVGFALFDKLESHASTHTSGLQERQWSRREIENYLCTPQALHRWAASEGARQAGELFEQHWVDVMKRLISELEQSLRTLDRPGPWSDSIKVTDEFLNPLFRRFFKTLKLPNLIDKSDFHVLATHVEPKEIDPEVRAVLDAIHAIATQARPEAEPA